MSFIRRNEERTTIVREHVNGGDGHFQSRQILNSVEEMSGKGRLFSHITLEKGCEVGWHVHSGDGEVYYILKGQATYTDDTGTTTLHPGDLSVVYDGEGHSVRNDEDEPMEFIALILYK